MDGRIPLEIPGDVIGCRLAGDAQLAGQAEVGNPVNDTEVDCFCVGTLLRSDFLERNAQHFSRRSPVNIFFIDKCPD